MASLAAVSSLLVIFSFCLIAISARRNRELRQRAEETLVELEMQRAEDFFRADNPASALAHLAWVLRQFPSSHLAAERLLSALSYRTRTGSIEWSPEGQHVAGALDCESIPWTIRGQPTSLPLKHDSDVLLARLTANGAFVVSMDRTNAYVWNMHTLTRVTKPVPHGNSLFLPALSPDGRWLATASRTNVTVWELLRGQPLKESLLLPYPSQGLILGIEFSPVDDLLAIATARGVVVWDVPSRLLIAEFPHHSTCGIRFSQDGNWLATAPDRNTASIWNARTGKPLSPPLAHDGMLTSIEFSPDGRWLATTSGYRVVRVWNVQTGKLRFDPLTFEVNIEFVRFSPDGRTLITGSSDTAWLWDATTGRRRLGPIGQTADGSVLQFSPDATRFASATGVEVRVCDARTRLSLSEPMKHETTVRSAQLSEDGRWLLTVAGPFVRLWELPNIPATDSPAWLPELAEAIAGQRLDEQRNTAVVSATNYFLLKQRFAQGATGNAYERWAAWFFDDTPARKISPSAPLTTEEYISRRLEENTLDALHEAVRLSPTNALALAKLARLILSQPAAENPRRIGEADFLSRRAVQLAPADEEVAALRAEVAAKLAEEPKARPD